MKLNEDQNNIKDLLIITNLKELEIEYISKMVEFYCGITSEEVYTNSQKFYQDFFHPEDLDVFIQHLESFKNFSGNEEKAITLKVKQKEEHYLPFLLKSRPYKNPNIKKNLILSTANILEESFVQASRKNTSNKVSKGEYKHIIDSIDEAFCVVEMIFDKEVNPVDYLFTQTNPSFEKQVQLKNVVGKTMRELVPDHEEYWFETYGKVAKTGEPIRFEYCTKKLNNDWLDLYAFKLGNEFSRRVAVLFRNITARKKAEEELLKSKRNLEKQTLQKQKELKENQELLQSVFENTNLAIAILRPEYNEENKIIDFTFAKVNKLLQKMYLQEDVIGSSYLKISKYGVKLGHFEIFKQVIYSKKPFDKDFYFGEDEYDNWFRLTARAQNDLLILTIEDTTQKNKEQIQLQETVRFNEQLLHTSPDTIMIINLNSLSVRYINKDIFKEGGITRERVKGTSLPDVLPFVHPKDRERIMEMHYKLLKSSDNDIVNIEIRLKLNGTSWEWFNVRGKIFRRKSADWVEEYVLLVRNIQEQKVTEKALLKAENLSIQGEVARTFAHELRNPLASIRMATEIISKKINDSQKEEFEKYFQILTGSTKTLDNLVTNLLNSSNYTPAVLAKNDLAIIVNEVIEKASDRIYLSGINVIKKYDKNYTILADKDKLKIAILNIIVNASEAVVPDEGLIEIQIEEEENDFVLSIKDNGHGLEKEQKDKLFDPFYTNKENGVGVGLSSVKNILEDHDAQIRVFSEAGKGTEFKIYFQNANLE